MMGDFFLAGCRVSDMKTRGSPTPKYLLRYDQSLLWRTRRARSVGGFLTTM